MTYLFDNEEYNLTLSYTKTILPRNKKECTLVIVYGLSEKHPMKLLTNIEINDKEDVIRMARLYFSRRRIDEHFRSKKQEYDFENMRVRTLNPKSVQFWHVLIWDFLCFFITYYLL